MSFYLLAVVFVSMAKSDKLPPQTPAVKPGAVLGTQDQSDLLPASECAHK